MLFTKAAASLLLALVAVPLLPTEGLAQRARGSAGNRPVIWRDPGNIAAKDLFWGAGSRERAPVPPFTFEKEDRGGESPKFDVRDANGDRWRVKLGPEAQAEVVATRIVWAMGYFVEEAYYFDRVEVQGMPRLSRGREFVENDRVVRGARFEPRRENVTRGETWDWRKNPFVGTRELNGLKTLMVLLANYDARPENNLIMTWRDPASRRVEDRYVVSDLGATLGAVGGLGGKRSKNNLADYRSQTLVKRVQQGMVEFQYRTRPTGLGVFTFVFWPPYWNSQTAKEKAMRRIRADHVRWIAGMLDRLSDRQLRDAFAAAGYRPGTADGFVAAIQGRIEELKQTPARRPARLASR